MEQIDVVVIGAGVVGLAVARALALAGRDVLIVEALSEFGSVTSARNSEVIHAGIYYPKDSLKATLCVAGREQLYEFCERYGVPYRRCGKLIVATSAAQQAELEKIRLAALDNGVTLQLLERDEALRMEPQLQCVGALHSPMTGIVDSHGLMLALLGQAQNAGATLVCETCVTRGWVRHDGICLAFNGESEPSVRARGIVNCAGLRAVEVAGVLQDFPQRHIPEAYFVKGNYFSLRGRAPFSRLIYPVPEPGGLGIHLTLDLGGQARFGPDVEWLQGGDAVDYAVDARRGERFYAAIRKYWSQLPDDALLPAYAGVRPKIAGPSEAAADFRFDCPAHHGVPGVVNLFGIESPGLTASLAIADRVARMIAE